MRAEGLKEQGEKSVCHGRLTPRCAAIRTIQKMTRPCGENRCNLLVHCRDISTEPSPDGSHRRPISGGRMVDRVLGAGLSQAIRGSLH